MASGCSASAFGLALRISTVRELSVGDWKAYRSHRSRRWSPSGGPRLSPVKWLDIYKHLSGALLFRRQLTAAACGSGEKPAEPGQRDRRQCGLAIALACHAMV